MLALSPSRLAASSVSARSPCSSRATIPTRSRRPVTVRAVAEPEREEQGSRTVSPSPAAPSVQLNKFWQRYEAPMLSSGVGAAVVTTWCVLRGQDPGTAASITVLATITAMVLNELLFEDSN